MTTTNTTKTAKQIKTTWALYLSGRMIAEGEALSATLPTSIGAATSAAFAAAETDAKATHGALLSPLARASYRFSVWGPKGGAVVHMGSL